MSAKLKVYVNRSIARNYWTIVAAPSKVAACKSLGVRADSKKVMVLDGTAEPFFTDGPSLALATPGVPWQRSRGDWVCVNAFDGAKAIVRLRFPEARADTGDHGETGIWVGDYGRPIGSGTFEGAAWLDASRRISVESPYGLPEDAITIWRFDDAPQVLRELSDHGGDEDWLALIPAKLADAYIGWMESGSSFGRSGVSRYPIRGAEVRIGCH